jgi:phosphoglycolate phosphatase
VHRLVLWDIDGTLVDSAGLGREAFADAFTVLFGTHPSGLVSLNGRTDREIALDLLSRNGVEDAHRHVDTFSSALADALADRAELIRERGRTYPGARAALERLDREPGVVQTVLTGNIEPNAAVKLDAFSLTGYLDLGVGAYGFDHAVRSELVAIARQRAGDKYGVAFEPSESVVIGDTPLDVAAGRAAGARVVAVASGPFGEPELRSAGADEVLADLTDLGAVLGAVAGASRNPKS